MYMYVSHLTSVPQRQLSHILCHSHVNECNWIVTAFWLHWKLFAQSLLREKIKWYWKSGLRLYVVCDNGSAHSKLQNRTFDKMKCDKMVAITTVAAKVGKSLSRNICFHWHKFCLFCVVRHFYFSVYT